MSGPLARIVGDGMDGPVYEDGPELGPDTKWCRRDRRSTRGSPWLTEVGLEFVALMGPVLGSSFGVLVSARTWRIETSGATVQVLRPQPVTGELCYCSPGRREQGRRRPSS